MHVLGNVGVAAEILEAVSETIKHEAGVVADGLVDQAATARDEYGLGRAIGNLAAHLKRIGFSFVDWDAIKVAAERPEALPDAHAGTRSSGRMSVRPGRRAVR